jgi:hypothetical protein
MKKPISFLIQPIWIILGILLLAILAGLFDEFITAALQAVI